MERIGRDTGSVTVNGSIIVGKMTAWKRKKCVIKTFCDLLGQDTRKRIWIYTHKVEKDSKQHYTFN